MAKGKIEKRGARKRHIKPVILIVTEGSKTEPKYFEHFRNRKTNIDIRIVGNRSNGGETDYDSLLKKAQEFQKKNQLSPENGDSVWIVADGDINFSGSESVTQKNSRLEQIRKLAHQSGINVVISNPCFELWYLLHFRYTTKYFCDYNAVKAELFSWFPEYEKSADVYVTLADYIDQAVANAKRLEQYHVKNGETLPFHLKTNPFTEVYQLIELLGTKQ